jgi:c(7)-type cytochrome triheme protein
MHRIDRPRLTLVVALSAGVGLVATLLVPALIAWGMPARVRIPRAAQARPFAPAARAQFSHPAHEPLRCFQCHPGLFPQAAFAFTHAEMDRGRFCGGCHDGQRATAIAKLACETCHAR